MTSSSVSRSQALQKTVSPSCRRQALPPQRLSRVADAVERVIPPSSRRQAPPPPPQRLRGRRAPYVVRGAVPPSSRRQVFPPPKKKVSVVSSGAPKVSDSPPQKAETKTDLVCWYFNKEYQTSKGKEEKIGKFVKLFQTHRDRFEDLMRKEKFTDLETSFLFNHFITLHKAVENWNKAFETVVQKANEGKIRESIEDYRTLLEKEVLEFISILNNSVITVLNLFREEVWDDRLENVLNKLERELEEKKDPAHIPGLSWFLKNNMMKIPGWATEFPVIYRDLINDKTRKSLKEIPEELNGVPQKLLDAAAESSRCKDQFERIFKTKDQFIDFFDFEGLEKEEYQDILQNHGWLGWLGVFGNKIKEFNKLYEDLGEHIHPLEEAVQAIRVESDQDKAQKLHAQRDELMRRTLHKVEKIKNKFTILGGDERLTSIREIGAKIADLYEEKYAQQIEKEFKELVRKKLQDELKNISKKLNRNLAIEKLQNELIDIIEKFSREKIEVMEPGYMDLNLPSLRNENLKDDKDLKTLLTSIREMGAEVAGPYKEEDTQQILKELEEINKRLNQEKNKYRAPGYMDLNLPSLRNENVKDVEGINDLMGRLDDGKVNEIVKDLVTHLNDKILEVHDGKRAVRKNKFKEELNLIERMHFRERIQEKGEELINLFHDRLNYFVGENSSI